MEETSVNDFFEAFGSEDYQSDTATEEEVKDTADGEESAAETSVDEQSTELSEPDKEAEETQTEPQTEPQEEPKYTIRVNHRDVTCTEEEYKAYAQKGADYDRVKSSNEQMKSENAKLTETISSMQSTIDELSSLAEASGVTVQELMREFRKTKYTAQGYSEREAQLALERDDAKKAAYTQEKKEETTQERAARDLKEFSENFPGVTVTEELVSQLMGDIEKGLSMTNAYKNLQDANAKKEVDDLKRQISELQNKLKANEQNKKNLAGSTGSVNDSGVKRKNSSIDDFFSAF